MINREALDAALADAAPGELVSLGSEITGRGLVALVAQKEDPPPVPSFITAAEAGRIAGVAGGRVYDWARGKRWAHRPTRRCLRIDEKGFREWLASR